MAYRQIDREASKDPSFEDHAKLVVHKMRGDLSELLALVEADPTRPQDMARKFGLNKNMTWKISRIVCETDPYAVIPHIPGKAGMGKAKETRR